MVETDAERPAPGAKLDRKWLCDELRRLHRTLDRIPTHTDIDDHGRCSPSTYTDRFETVSHARVESGIHPPIETCVSDYIRSRCDEWGEPVYFTTKRITEAVEPGFTTRMVSSCIRTWCKRGFADDEPWIEPYTSNRPIQWVAGFDDDVHTDILNNE